MIRPLMAKQLLESRSSMKPHCLGMFRQKHLLIQKKKLA